VLRKFGGLEPFSDSLAAHGCGVEIVRVQRLDQGPDGRFLLQCLEKTSERRGLDHESRRHLDAGALQLAEASALAADVRPVLQTDVGKPTDDLCRSHIRTYITDGPTAEW